MSDVRWEGFSHEEIYSRVQQGPGRLASADAEAAWSTVESTIRTVDAQLTRAVRQIGAGWQGRAAEAVQGGMTVMSNWALDAAGDASLTKNGIGAQAEQAGRLRSAMPPPRTAEWSRIVHEEVPGVGLMSSMGDLGALEEQMANDHAVAVDMMARYSSQSSDNQRLMNYWTQPPTVVVEAAAGPATTRLGAAGAVGVRPGAGGLRTGSAAEGSSGGGGIDPSATTVPAVVGFPHTAAAAPSSGRRGGAATPTDIGPVTGERPGRVGSAATPGRPPGAVVPYPNAQIGRRGSGAAPGTAADRGDPVAVPRTGTIPVGVRPGAEGRGPGSVGRWPRSDPAVGGDVRPTVPAPPARPGVVTDGRTSMRTPPAAPLDTAEPPARPPRGPTPGTGEPPPRVAGAPTEAAAERVAAGRSASAGHGILPMGGAVRPTEQDHRRATYLLDDTDAFADDRWFPPPVISGDALVSPRGG
ncbi:MAG TPA: PPE domain-containing protein [Pseudonocardia sp.]|nr:PPE domain-containing protein [Pseudonocardia sp.]